MKSLYIIGGCNGSGKTTISKQILPNFLKVYEYVNADEIASGISPFRPESVAIQAGKLMLKRLNFRKRSGGYATKGIDSSFISGTEGTIASPLSSVSIALGTKDGVENPPLCAVMVSRIKSKTLRF